MNTFKALVGIGILAIPSSFRDVGILGGLVGTIVILMLSNYANIQLIRTIRRVSNV
jgi:amino acid permease